MDWSDKSSLLRGTFFLIKWRGSERQKDLTFIISILLLEGWCVMDQANKFVHIYHDYVDTQTITWKWFPRISSSTSNIRSQGFTEQRLCVLFISVTAPMYKLNPWTWLMEGFAPTRIMFRLHMFLRFLTPAWSCILAWSIHEDVHGYLLSHFINLQFCLFLGCSVCHFKVCTLVYLVATT